MKKIITNKLVRDKIPEIIQADARQSKVIILDNEQEYLEALYAKLDEETCELKSDKNIGEIVDVMEVLLAISKTYGYSEKETIAKLHAKRDSRGGFNKRLFMKSFESY